MSHFLPYTDKYDHTVSWPTGLPWPADVDVTNCSRHFDMRQGPGYHRPLIGLRGLAIEHVDGGILIHGDRNLQDRTQEGYAMHGSVSVDGKRRGAITSSQLFVGPDGKLYNFAVLYVCKPRV